MEVNDANRVKKRWTKAKNKNSSGQFREYFNKMTYKRRVEMSAETMLAEANARAKREGKKAYVHVVGLGLGVWRLLKLQDVSTTQNYMLGRIGYVLCISVWISLSFLHLFLPVRT